MIDIDLSNVNKSDIDLTLEEYLSKFNLTRGESKPIVLSKCSTYLFKTGKIFWIGNVEPTYSFATFRFQGYRICSNKIWKEANNFTFQNLEQKDFMDVTAHQVLVNLSYLISCLNSLYKDINACYDAITEVCQLKKVPYSYLTQENYLKGFVSDFLTKYKGLKIKEIINERKNQLDTLNAEINAAKMHNDQYKDSILLHKCADELEIFRLKDFYSRIKKQNFGFVQLQDGIPNLNVCRISTSANNNQFIMEEISSFTQQVEKFYNSLFSIYEARN